MTLNKKRNEICGICKLPIHETNLHKISKGYVHYICWLQFEQKIDNMIKEDIKKRRPIMWLKAIGISIIINFFLWWAILELIKRAINIWGG